MGLKRGFAAAVVTAGAAVGLAGAAEAAPIGHCTPDSGTIVAVDFAHWGGPIVRGCGLRQHSDYDLLHAAGFTTAGDQHDGPAFICRLGNAAFHHGTQYPTTAQDDCVLTPAASAYWSYWLAPAGQNHWSYSQQGAMNAVPKPGEVELWTFGATNIAGTRGSGVPAFSPATVRANNPPPPPSTTTTHASTPPTTTASATQTTAAASITTTASAPRARHRHVARARAPHPAAATHHRRPGHGSTSSTSTSSTSTATSATRLVNAQATKQPTSSSSAAPVLIGLGLVLLLCAGAGWTIWQRRRYE